MMPRNYGIAHCLWKSYEPTTRSLQLCNLAKNFDRAIRRRQLLEQFRVILQALPGISQELTQPAGILGLGLRHIAHTQLEIFTVRVHCSDHDLVAEDKLQVDPVRRNRDHLVTASDAGEHEHAIFAEGLHAIDHDGRIAGAFEDEVKSAMLYVTV